MKAGALGFAVVAMLVCDFAHAQPQQSTSKPKPAEVKHRSEVPVLSLASEDAEDQAEALSGALRSRLRATPGVNVDDTTLNVDTITTALGCKLGDPACHLKVGNQLKVERYVWGTVRRSSERGQVVAELHMWHRGKPETVASETFSENLRDQNDDVLRRIAGRLIDRVMGRPVSAAITVRAGDVTGELVVDGKARQPLIRGEATVELGPGKHVVEVRADGYKPQAQEVDVTGGGEQLLSMKLTPLEEERPSKPGKPISTRTILALGFIGVGVGFGIAGTVKGVEWLSIKEENDRDYRELRGDFCGARGPGDSPAVELAAACDRLERGKSAATMELIFYGVGIAAVGTGLVLLVTDPGASPAADKVAAKKKTDSGFRVMPRIGHEAGGVDLSLRF